MLVLGTDPISNAAPGPVDDRSVLTNRRFTDGRFHRSLLAMQWFGLAAWLFTAELP